MVGRLARGQAPDVETDVMNPGVTALRAGPAVAVRGPPRGMTRGGSTTAAMTTNHAGIPRGKDGLEMTTVLRGMTRRGLHTVPAVGEGQTVQLRYTVVIVGPMRAGGA